MVRVTAAISRITVQRDGGADDWLANSSSDSGRKSISSVLPTTPCQPRSRMRSTISTGLAPASARSPPWRIKSGEVCCRSARTASKAVRFPWMSDTIAVRITEFWGIAPSKGNFRSSQLVPGQTLLRHQTADLTSQRKYEKPIRVKIAYFRAPLRPANSPSPCFLLPLRYVHADNEEPKGERQFPQCGGHQKAAGSEPS